MTHQYSLSLKKKLSEDICIRHTQKKQRFIGRFLHLFVLVLDIFDIVPLH